jgi:peptidoglycan/LPS O-acetylase OafA/YrhL
MPTSIAQKAVPEPAISANNLGAVRYVPAFDGLRAICVLLVVLFHVISSDRPWLQNIARRGWCGVDVFFVLSGFLITWILVAEQDQTETINLPRFYLRRVMRLQPAYFSGLLIFSALIFLFHREKFPVIDNALPYFLTYTLNLGLAFGFLEYPPYGQAWSLCIEEQFYLCWPWMLGQFSAEKLLSAILWIIGAVAVYRTIVYVWVTWPDPATPSMAALDRIFYGTDTRIDTILSGCGFALALRLGVLDRFIEHLRKPWFTNLALGMMLAVFAWSTGGSFKGGWRAATIGFTLMAGAAGLLIVALFLNGDSIWSRLLAKKPLVFIGKISYGIYLFHEIIWSAYARLFHLSDAAIGSLPEEIAALTIVTGLSIMAAALHYRFIEMRFFRLRDRQERSLGRRGR